MRAVVGVFQDTQAAVAAADALRRTTEDLSRVRLVGSTEETPDLVDETGPGMALATGPVDPVVGGILDTRLGEDALHDLETRIAEGAVLVVADVEADQDLDQTMQFLRDHGATYAGEVND